MRKLYMHIGMPKVASSTIQSFIYNKSDELLSRNVLVPSFLGHKNNRLLFSIVKNEFGESDTAVFRRGLRGEQDVNEFFDRVKRKINSVFSGDYEKAVISCEQLASLDVEKIEFLNTLLIKYFSEIDVILYLRRQDVRLVSGYSTQIVSGRGALYGDEFLFPDSSRENLNYYELVKKWASVFGKDSIKVRVLDKKFLVGGGVLSDFQEVIGEKVFEGLDYKYTENKSMSAALIEVIKKVNIELKKDSFDQYQKSKIGALTHEVAKRCRAEGEKFYPSRLSAESFYANFKDSNQQLAKEFIGRNELFDEDFSMYPESDVKVDAISENDAAVKFIVELIKRDLHK